MEPTHALTDCNSTDVYTQHFFKKDKNQEKTYKEYSKLSELDPSSKHVTSAYHRLIKGQTQHTSGVGSPS